MASACTYMNHITIQIHASNIHTSMHKIKCKILGKKLKFHTLKKRKQKSLVNFLPNFA